MVSLMLQARTAIDSTLKSMAVARADWFKIHLLVEAGAKQ